LQDTFATLLSHQSKEEQIKTHLVGTIVLNEYDKTQRRKQQPSVIYALIDTLPQLLNQETKLTLLREKLTNYPAMPVITAHPTRVLSNPAQLKLHHLIILASELDKPGSKEHALQEEIKRSIRLLLAEPLIPPHNLSPKEEADMALFIYQNMLDAFPEFTKQVVNHYLTVHGGERTLVEQQLKPAVMESFRNISSWVRGDADGNHQVTAETMAITVPAQQIAIIQLYIKRLDKIIDLLNQDNFFSLIDNLESAKAYLQRCIQAIQIGIWFDLAGSEKAKKRFIDKLQQSVNDTNELPSVQHDIIELQDLIALEGFFGGMKEYVRQTTKLNNFVLDDLIGLLAEADEEIRYFMQRNEEIPRRYHQLERDEKIELMNKFSSNPELFALLKHKEAQFSKETKKELNRLLFISKHQDIFPSYISSDTEDKINANELLILFHLASYLDHSLRIGQVRTYPINSLPLCETPADLANFETIFRDMLDDEHMRERIIESKFISYVSGPSDLGKNGGIAVYIALLRNQMIAEHILDEYKNKYPELQQVTLRVLNGFGGDMKRRIGSARQQAHCTHQGAGAYDVLGAPHAYSSFLHDVVGFPSEIHYRVQELRHLKNQHPKYFKALINLEQHAVKHYERFIKSQNNKNLLIALTDFAIEKGLNISSRAGSKAVGSDPTQVRAIGVVNLYLLTGVNWDVFMSLVGLNELSQEDRQALPYLFEHSSGVKDIVYKVLFSIAISDIPRAWSKIIPDQAPPSQHLKSSWVQIYLDDSIEDKTLEHTLAYIEACALSILRDLSVCLPVLQHDRARKFWDSTTENKPSNLLALELMEALGGDFAQLALETRELLPRFKDLADCVDAYKKNPNPATLEHAVLACRGFPLAEGPRMIAELRSPLHQKAINNPWPTHAVVEEETEERDYRAKPW